MERASYKVFSQEYTQYPPTYLYKDVNKAIYLTEPLPKYLPPGAQFTRYTFLPFDDQNATIVSEDNAVFPLKPTVLCLTFTIPRGQTSYPYTYTAQLITQDGSTPELKNNNLSRKKLGDMMHSINDLNLDIIPLEYRPTVYQYYGEKELNPLYSFESYSEWLSRITPNHLLQPIKNKLKSETRQSPFPLRFDLLDTPFTAISVENIYKKIHGFRNQLPLILESLNEEQRSAVLKDEVTIEDLIDLKVSKDMRNQFLSYWHNMEALGIHIKDISQINDHLRQKKLPPLIANENEVILPDESIAYINQVGAARRAKEMVLTLTENFLDIVVLNPDVFDGPLLQSAAQKIQQYCLENQTTNLGVIWRKAIEGAICLIQKQDANNELSRDYYSRLIAELNALMESNKNLERESLFGQ